MLNELSPIDKYVTISIGIYKDRAKENIKSWSFVVKAYQELYRNKLKRKI
jgi:GGDEF domain-containing protein